LKTNLSEYVQFQVPVGGMAVWTQFDPAINLTALSQKALQHELYFSPGYRNEELSPVLNATRLGFASSTPDELGSCVEILRKLLSS